MKMRTGAITTLILVLVLSLAGCGSGSSGGTDTKKNTDKSTSTAQMKVVDIDKEAVTAQLIPPVKGIFLGVDHTTLKNYTEIVVYSDDQAINELIDWYTKALADLDFVDAKAIKAEEEAARLKAQEQAAKENGTELSAPPAPEEGTQSDHEMMKSHEFDGYIQGNPINIELFQEGFKLDGQWSGKYSVSINLMWK